MLEECSLSDVIAKAEADIPPQGRDFRFLTRSGHWSASGFSPYQGDRLISYDAASECREGHETVRGGVTPLEGKMR